MLRVGLTGGIGCGKSAACRLFQQYNVPVIDADHIAKELVKPGKPALQQIVDTFGDHFIQADGHLNRALLKEKVFSDSYLLKQLESILHPAIRAQIAQQMESYQATTISYLIVDVPLLIEKGYQDLFDEIIVVDCTQQQQLQRVASRDHLEDKAIRAIIDKQASRKERLEIATETLDNTGSIEALASQVEAIHRKFSC